MQNFFLKSIKFKIFGVVFSIFFIVIALGAYYNYTSIKKEISKDLKKETKQLIRLLQKQISITLYNLDYINTKKTIDTFFNKTYFTKIQILHENGDLFADTSLDTIENPKVKQFQDIKNGIAEENVIYSPIITDNKENIGGIVIYKNHNIYKNALDDIEFKILITYLVTILTVLVASYIVSLYITKPILRMVTILDKIKKNDLLAFHIDSKDEFEFLSHVIEKKHNELINHMTHDNLTGVYNRSKFDSELKSEIEKFNRNKMNFCLTIIDFDHFKKINDTYGHLIGDKVLIKVSQLISTSIRKTDIFARWGGEEFVILMYNTNIDGALILLEKLRVNIENLYIQEVGSITCSFGVSEFQKNDTSDSIIKRCDDALYDAKKLGRNRVVRN